jgi:tetratricopeptide (TPR) repeat protein
MNEDIAARFGEAEFLLSKSRHFEALNLLTSLRDGLGRNAEPILNGACHQLIGVAFLGLTRPIDAMTAFQQARTAFQGLGMARNVAACDGNLANALRDLSRWNEAIEHYRSASAIFLDLGLEFEEAISSMNIGVSFRDLGQPLDAIEQFNKAITVFRRLDRQRPLT